MALLITLTIAGVAGYLNITLNEEIEIVSAGLVACLCIVLAVFFAPLLIKFALLTALLLLPKFNLV